MSGRGFRLDWGSGTLAAELGHDDLSVSYDATTGQVRALPGGEVLGEDVFGVLDDLLDGDPDTCWVGWFGYAARPDLPARAQPGVVDAVWMRTRPTWRPGRVRKRLPQRPLPHSTPPGWYAEAFAEVQRQLRAGNSYEVNLTYRIEVDAAIDPTRAYGRLCAVNPAPYAAHLWHHGTHLLSSSPELFAAIDADRTLRTRPIKGTTERSTDPDEDDRLREHLATDPKFRAENLMITDLLRNDLAQVCEPGTVAVPALMVVESHPSVHQLVSTVEGRLAAGMRTLPALRALFPAGSMTGAPKRRTMEIIAAVEPSPRGVYAGAFGWIRGDGTAELAVVIRSLVRAPGGTWRIGTGGGLTVRSDLGEEWDEAEAKVGRLLPVLDPGEPLR